jgi:hypothetical protein
MLSDWWKQFAEIFRATAQVQGSAPSAATQAQGSAPAAVTSKDFMLGRWLLRVLGLMVVPPLLILYLRGLAWLVDSLSPPPHRRLLLGIHYLGEVLSLLLQPAPVWAATIVVGMFVFRKLILGLAGRLRGFKLGQQEGVGIEMAFLEDAKTLGLPPPPQNSSSVESGQQLAAATPSQSLAAAPQQSTGVVPGQGQGTPGKT